MTRTRTKAISTERLSPQAKRLVELTYDAGTTLSQALRENPDLIGGLDEYHAWHADNHTAISTKSEMPDTDHGVKRAAKKLTGK